MISQTEAETAIERLTQPIADQLANGNYPNPILVGIHTGGFELATLLHQRLGMEIELNAVDVALYRDDYTTRGIKLSRSNTRLPPRVDGTNIILIDDVLHTGRTVRSALELLFSYGRPASVTLAVLFDRGGRQVPIQPDLCGEVIRLTGQESIKLRFGESGIEIINVTMGADDVDHPV